MQNATSIQAGRPSTVFIAEDSLPVRHRLAELLQAGGELEVIGQADTPAAAIEGIRRTQPDSVVLDIHLLGGTGLEVIRKIRPEQPGTVFVILTNHANVQYRQAFMKAGALCVLDKTAEFEKVRDTLLAACPRAKAN